MILDRLQTLGLTIDYFLRISNTNTKITFLEPIPIVHFQKTNTNTEPIVDGFFCKILGMTNGRMFGEIR